MKKEIDIHKAIPFLRWAGGKKWLIKRINDFLPQNGFNSYHEPFVGGGAIFFNLNPNGQSHLNDFNSELIETYFCVKENVEGVIEELKQFKNTEEFYYKVRASKYRSDIKRAARFIYLNQTSFNGIYRVNLKGEYNVPYGYRTKNFLDESTLYAASDRLQKAILTQGDFTNSLERIQENDLVFLDPPYTITHNNNGFFQYNAKLFSKDDQYRLSEMIDLIKGRNAYYILTNAAHDDVKAIFNKGDYMIDLKRASLIGGKNAPRNKYAEVIITNCIR